VAIGGSGVGVAGSGVGVAVGGSGVGVGGSEVGVAIGGSGVGVGAISSGATVAAETSDTDFGAFPPQPAKSITTKFRQIICWNNFWYFIVILSSVQLKFHFQ